MIFSLLLAGLHIIGLVSGDDSTSSAGDNDATITSMTTANPTYTVLTPTDSPTLDLFGSVTIIWSAEGYNVGGYFCRPSTTSSGIYLYTSWMSPQAAVTISRLTTYEAELVGSIMFASNYAGFPATCYFGMATDIKEGPDSTGGGDLFVELTSFPGGETVSMPTTTMDTQQNSMISPVQKTVFVTATSTVPPIYTVQPLPSETILQPIPETGKNHDISGGAIAGIVVGSVSGTLILVGLVIWQTTVRRRTSTPDAVLPGLKEAIALIKASFRKKLPASEPSSPSIERGDAVHEMSVPDRTVFELESPPQRYTDGHHELPEK